MPFGFHGLKISPQLPSTVGMSWWTPIFNPFANVFTQLLFFPPQILFLAESFPSFSLTFIVSRKEIMLNTNVSLGLEGC